MRSSLTPRIALFNDQCSSSLVLAVQNTDSLSQSLRTLLIQQITGKKEQQNMLKTGKTYRILHQICTNIFMTPLSISIFFRISELVKMEKQSLMVHHNMKSFWRNRQIMDNHKMSPIKWILGESPAQYCRYKTKLNIMKVVCTSCAIPSCQLSTHIGRGRFCIVSHIFWQIGPHNIRNGCSSEVIRASLKKKVLKTSPFTKNSWKFLRISRISRDLFKTKN